MGNIIAFQEEVSFELCENLLNGSLALPMQRLPLTEFSMQYAYEIME